MFELLHVKKLMKSGKREGKKHPDQYIGVGVFQEILSDLFLLPSRRKEASEPAEPKHNLQRSPPRHSHQHRCPSTLQSPMGVHKGGGADGSEGAVASLERQMLAGAVPEHSPEDRGFPQFKSVLGGKARGTQVHRAG